MTSSSRGVNFEGTREVASGNQTETAQIIKKTLGFMEPTDTSLITEKSDFCEFLLTSRAFFPAFIVFSVQYLNSPRLLIKDNRLIPLVLFFNCSN